MLLWARAAIVSSILLYIPNLLEQFDHPKAVAVRVLGVGALAGAIALLLRRERYGYPPSRWQVLDAAICVWFGVEIAATAASQAPRLSLFGDYKQHEGLLTSLGLLGVYVSARLGTRSPEDARRTLQWMVVAASLACLYALVQLLSLDRLAWMNSAYYAEGRFRRPFGTLGHPNVLGVTTAAALSIAVPNALLGRSLRWWWCGAAVLLGATTVSTLSRGAWLGAAAGMVVSVAAALASDSKLRGRARVAVVWLLVAALAVAVLFVSVDLLRTRFLELLSPTSGPSRARLEIWRTALGMWLAHPWLGVGPDAFLLLFQRFQTPEFWRLEWGTIHFHAHSIYLHTLATRGLAGAGAGLFGAICFAGAVRALWTRAGEARAVAAPMVGGFASMAVSGGFGALGTAGATGVAVLLGTIGACVAQPRPGSAGSAAAPGAAPRSAGRASATANAERRGAPRARKGPLTSQGSLRSEGARTWLAGLAAAMAMLVASLTELRASEAISYARDLVLRGTSPFPDAAIAALADRAERLQPEDDQIAKLRAKAYLFFGTMRRPPRGDSLASRMVEGLLSEAERSARRAVASLPQRASNHQVLGNILVIRARDGDPRALSQAVEAYRHCWEWAPLDGIALAQFAYSAVELGRPELAIAPARRAASLYPGEAMTQTIYGTASLAVGDTAAAIEALTRSLSGAWRDAPMSRARAQVLLGELRARRQGQAAAPR